MRYIILISFIGFIALVFLMYKESKDWEEFKIANNCKIVEKIAPTTFTTFTIDSQGRPITGIGSTAGKTGWKCEDGVTYYR